MTEPTSDRFASYGRLAESIRERFGDNWQIVYDEEYDDEVSVRTEDSAPRFFTEMFTTSQTSTEDPLEVAGFLAAAIDMVPALLADRDRLAKRQANIETAVFQMFAKADEQGVKLDACAVAELTRFVMVAIRSGAEP